MTESDQESSQSASIVSSQLFDRYYGRSYEIREEQSYELSGVVGYAILILILLDFIAQIVPPQFTNALWLFNTIGAFVERIWGLLIGYFLIFFQRHRTGNGGSALKILKIASGSSLVFAIIYALMIPLAVLSTIQLYQGITNSFTKQSDLLKAEISQARAGVEKMTNASDLARAAQQLGVKVASRDQTVQQLQKALTTREKKAKEQLTENRRNEKLNLVKQSLKWILGALVSTASLFMVWNLTRWIRVL
jgi:hypothetical protein